jgi:mannose-6-phosphate isomerase-like protein (cupin superfamily)
MHRRSFLKTAAAAMPTLSLQDLLGSDAFALPVAPPAAPELHVVGAADDRTGHPHSLGFSTLLFKVQTQDTAGNLFVIEHRNLIAGGPPLHQHWSQEEWFYVMEGDVAFQVGDQRVTLHPGESVLGPRRVPHTFSALGATPAHLLIAFAPAGKMEAYFRDAVHPPAGVSPAAFFRRYDMDYLGPNPFSKS